MSPNSGLAPVSHNQVGQKLGRKGQETRERIIGAMLRLLADRDGPPVTLAGVAKEARVRPPNLYLYFPDLGALLLAALARVMDTAEDAFVGRLRVFWPDETLEQSCLAFLHAHHEFWSRNARVLHLRNSLADAGDLRVLRYRYDATRPLIDLLARQIGANEDNLAVATVFLTGLERVATVVTNPQFDIMTGHSSPEDQRNHVDRLLEAEAEVMSAAIARRRALAQMASCGQAAARR